jgi:hypothetical protein
LLAAFSQAELDGVQVTGSLDRWLDARGEALLGTIRAREHQLDGFECVGDPSCCRASPVNKSAQLVVQFGVEVLHESREHVAALAWGEAETVVVADHGDGDATADELAAAKRATMMVLLLHGRQHLGLPRGWESVAAWRAAWRGG